MLSRPRCSAKQAQLRVSVGNSKAGLVKLVACGSKYSRRIRLASRKAGDLVCRQFDSSNQSAQLSSQFRINQLLSLQRGQVLLAHR